DEAGEPVRWVEGPAEAGVHRVNWDLRRPAPDPIDLTVPEFVPPWAGDPEGPLAPPGRYTAQLVLVSSSGAEHLGEPRSFAVKPVPTAPEGTDFVAVARFQSEAGELMRRVAGAGEEISRARDRLRHMRRALLRAPRAELALFQRLDTLEAELASLSRRLSSDPVRGRLNEPSVPSIRGRVSRVVNGHWDTRQAPTATQRRNLEIAARDFAALEGELITLLQTTLVGLEEDLEAAGAPWTPGRKLPRP
ncbi:MAG: glycosyl hydrolase, partial [Gemmatimonadales bacterium]